MTLLIQQAKFGLYQKQTLNLPHFAIEPQQYWVEAVMGVGNRRLL